MGLKGMHREITVMVMERDGDEQEGEDDSLTK